MTRHAPAMSSPTKRRAASLLGAALLACVLVLGGCGSGGSGSSAGTDASADGASSGATTEQTVTPAQSDFVGQWDLVSGTTDGLEAENLTTLAQNDLYVVMTLNADGTGTFDMSSLGSGKEDLTWVVTSKTEGTVTWDGDDYQIKVSDNEITLSNGTDSMVFHPHTATTMSTLEEVMGSDATSVVNGDGTQSIGNDYVGSMEVGDTWQDATSALDPQTVHDYAAVYYVDPDSQYDSTVLGQASYGRSVTMAAYSTPYDEVKENLIKSYNEDSMYSDVESEETTLNGCDAYLVMASIPDDEVYVFDVLVNKGDGTTVLITLQTTPDDDSVNMVLDYGATWEP